MLLLLLVSVMLISVLFLVRLIVCLFFCSWKVNLVSGVFFIVLLWVVKNMKWFLVYLCIGNIVCIFLFLVSGSRLMIGLLCVVGLVLGIWQILSQQMWLVLEKVSSVLWVLIIYSCLMMFLFFSVEVEWFLLLWCCVWQVLVGWCLMQLVCESVIIMFFGVIRLSMLRFFCEVWILV